MDLSSTDEVVEHLRSDVFVRLRPSPLHGIGVFAVRDIPAGVDPFQERKLGLSLIKVPIEAVMLDASIPEPVKGLVADLCSDRDGMINIPRCGLNGVMVLYYMNRSNDPNMEVDENYFFRSSRLIEAGEELTIDYFTYSEETATPR